MRMNYVRNASISVAVFYLLVLLLLAGAASQSRAAGLEAWPVSATLKVFPDDTMPAGATDELSMVALRNEYSPFQIALRSDTDVKGVHVSVSDFASGTDIIPSSAAELLLVEAVTIERPSIGATRKVWPDPLPPYHDFDLAAGTAKAVWVDLFIPDSTKPATYNGTVTISTPQGVVKTIKITVNVAAVELPYIPRIRTAFGISYGTINEAHKVKNDSPEALALDDAYYWFLVKHRLSPYYIPVDFFSEDAHKYLDDPRVNYLRPPYSYDDAQMRKIAERLKSTGWINKAVFYERDEPGPDSMAEVESIGKRLKSFDPALQYLITTGYNPRLKDANISVWCPSLIFTMNPNAMKGLRREVALGKKLWWYTCISPKWGGTDYFIDLHAMSPRALAWANYLYGVTGILYWQTTSWGSVGFNPWLKTETFILGNGDGSLLYPGSHVGYNGPVASIRLKMIREGMEDYDTLQLLGDALRAEAARIGGGATAYNVDGRLFEHAYALVTPEGRSNPNGPNTPYLMFMSYDYKQLEARRNMVFDELAGASQSPLLLISTDPVENGYTKKSVASVSGYAETGASVEVNGAPVSLNGNSFSTKVALKNGSNEIAVTARLGGKTKKVVRVVNVK